MELTFAAETVVCGPESRCSETVALSWDEPVLYSVVYVKNVDLVLWERN